MTARLRTYRRATGNLVVPHPRHPLPTGDVPSDPAGRDGRRIVLWFMTGAGAIWYSAMLVDAASESPLLLHARIMFGLALLAVIGCVGYVVFLKRGRGLVAAEVGRAWLDLVEGARLAHVEPDNPAAASALEQLEEVRALVARAVRATERDKPIFQDEVRRIQAAGAEVHATSEVWRREQQRRPGGGRTTTFDRLPPVTGPTVAEASAASDAASDEAMRALGLGDHDLDFDGYARRRAAMYRSRTGEDVWGQDPRQPLLDGSWRITATRPARRVARVVYAIGAALTAMLTLVGQPWWGLAPAAVTVVAGVWWGFAMVPDPSVLRVPLPPGPAMAWQDYLDQVGEADAGRLPVVTVEAIRGCERRVRTIMIELAAASASPAERAELEGELFRLCSEVWTLVGQARAEDRLLPG